MNEHLETAGLKTFKCIIEVKRVVCDEKGCYSIDEGDIPFNNIEACREGAVRAIKAAERESFFQRRVKRI